MTGEPRTYAVDDPESALKYAIQQMENDHVQIVEGRISALSSSWDHEHTKDAIRRQIRPALRRLSLCAGSGDLDLPGSPNWYVPDIAVVPTPLTENAGALLPGRTLLIVEVTSHGEEDTDRITKRRRYAEYGAPLYLLVDRQERSCTLFSEPGELGYTKADGPRPFGTPVRLPEPFELDLDTSEF
ncbi:Uma2 family endonuclease [Streptomyces luteireticuli]|uniref:Putative restriction endonuclease domain-containing protein n=1 Tax=Streptomyces luteireticuli TaxID=173858 RepID=A0ABN0YU11_9ACTN